jgi:HD associated region
MPKWGLSEEMRQTRPWGLDPLDLRPGKVITDPIQGDVYVTRLERAIIDSPAFQRLRRVRQLGMTHLVYPGAVHSRFSHALGAVRAAQDLLDAVFDQRDGLHARRPDLFLEWLAELGLAPGQPAEGYAAPQVLQAREAARSQFSKRLAETTVLTRLGALLHDFCHVPFGHAVEDDLGLLDPHDENPERFDELWRRLGDVVQKISPELRDELRRIVLSKLDEYEEELPKRDSRYPFVDDIVGNTICADLLDYLKRDHVYAGLPLAIGRRFVSAFYVTPSTDRFYPRRVALQVSRPTPLSRGLTADFESLRGDEHVAPMTDSAERTDVVTELLKHLRYRYELSERALYHHAKLAADVMVGKAIELWYEVEWIAAARSQNRQAQDISADDFDAFRQAVAQLYSKRAAKAALARMRSSAREALEEQLRVRGDDSFLEWLHEAPERLPADSRAAAIGELAGDVLARKLFKRVGFARQRDIRVTRQQFLALFASEPERRRKTEHAAAEFVGVEPWKVAVWLPPASMRMKLAEVLVDDGGDVMPFVVREQGRVRERGQEIYAAHEDLWAVGIYVHHSLRNRAMFDRIVFAYIAGEYGAAFHGVGGPFAKDPSTWTKRLAAETVLMERSPPPEILDDLIDGLVERAAEVPARGSGTSWEGLVAQLRDIAAAQ